VGGARALGSAASGSGSRNQSVRPDPFLDGVRVLVVEVPEALESLERYCRTGDGARGQEHLTTAVTMYRPMDMGFWLAQAEATLSGGGP
jgi:hypothetical protein